MLKAKSLPGRNISLGARTLGAIGLGLLLAACPGMNRQDPPVEDLTASEVCAAYGLRAGSATYDQCVAYQESRPPGPSVPPYKLDQYNNRVDAEGYRVDGTGHRMAIQSPYYFPTGR